ncbi:MAG TPA: radical SAM protein, partial [Desulfosalsimonadaceae bacterium]|nr:radical SAM protein [Desulfosalsimonadaceae bacterium]
DNINHLLSWRLAGGETCFLGDADGLIVRPDFFAAVAAEIRSLFPTISRFTIYGRTATAARRKNADELAAFSGAGLDRVHFGLESGCDEVLEFVRKGETRQDHLKGCLKTKEAGISCSVYVMPGLGGKQWSAAHARDTAALLSEIAPDYIRLRTLEIFPQTPLAKARDRGAFTELEEEEVVREIKSLVDNIDAEAMLLSDSAANLLDISGRLPQDREKMQNTIENYLALSEREKALFSLRARIRAFEGQYGGLSEELHQELSAWITDGALDVSKIPTDEARALTRRIRARLMP